MSKTKALQDNSRDQKRTRTESANANQLAPRPQEPPTPYVVIFQNGSLHYAPGDKAAELNQRPTLIALKSLEHTYRNLAITVKVALNKSEEPQMLPQAAWRLPPVAETEVANSPVQPWPEYIWPTASLERHWHTVHWLISQIAAPKETAALLTLAYCQVTLTVPEVHSVTFWASREALVQAKKEHDEQQSRNPAQPDTGATFILERCIQKLQKRVEAAR